MKERKRLIQVIALGVCTLLLCVSVLREQGGMVLINDEQIPLSNEYGTLISETEEDKKVVPDKYNTGAIGNLNIVGLGDTVEGISLSVGSNGTKNVLDFTYKNKQVSGTIEIHDFDFSSHPLTVYNTDKVDRKINIIFSNCKFSAISTAKPSGNISFEFNNCTIKSFNGSNAVFNSCKFGKSFNDGIVPFQNVSVNDSFFCDMANEDTNGAGYHTDGTQIYGANGIDVKNVFFNNCRFELPATVTDSTAAYVNACIMLQLEYSKAENVSFTNCLVNGGGCSIYARSVKEEYSFEKVSFKNIQVGNARRFGAFYSDISSKISFENVCETAKLYVGTVWKEENNTHISVTNDTGIERNLTIFTDSGKYDFTIPKCPVGNQLNSYEEFPFDIDICIPHDCEYIVCYDTTLEGSIKQIRFVNWGGKSVYLKDAPINAVYDRNNVSEEYVLNKGKCGKEISYTLTRDGVLTLTGKGNTYNYNSNKSVPWGEYISYIQEVNIGEGIEVLGTQIFRKCTGIRTIVLPEGLIEISSRAFEGCSFLTDITLPSTINCIGTNAFSGMLLQTNHYKGSLEAWNAIMIEEGNDILAQKLIIEEKKNNIMMMQPQINKAEILFQGNCGSNAYYEIYSDGVMVIKGDGNTYNYNSRKNAPWYDNKDIIKCVRVEEGITRLGQQLFRNCKALEEVSLPKSLFEIGSNSFTGCNNLNLIEVPGNVKKIGQFAFSGTGLARTIYDGKKDDWLNVDIGCRNEPLLKQVVFEY